MYCLVFGRGGNSKLVAGCSTFQKSKMITLKFSGGPKKQYRKAAALIPARLSDWLGHYYDIETCFAYSLR